MTLPIEKELRLMGARFSHSWNKMQMDNRLDMRDAYAFVRDLFTSPIITIQLRKPGSLLQTDSIGSLADDTGTSM